MGSAYKQSFIAGISGLVLIALLFILILFSTFLNPSILEIAFLIILFLTMLCISFFYKGFLHLGRVCAKRLFNVLIWLQILSYIMYAILFGVMLTAVLFSYDLFSIGEIVPLNSYLKDSLFIFLLVWGTILTGIVQIMIGIEYIKLRQMNDFAFVVGIFEIIAGIGRVFIVGTGLSVIAFIFEFIMMGKLAKGNFQVQNTKISTKI